MGIIDKIKNIKTVISSNYNSSVSASNTGVGRGYNYRSVGAKLEYGLDPLVVENYNRELLVNRSRQTEFDSPYYASLIQWLSTYVIGSGLNINIQPKWDLLGIDDLKERQKYQDIIEHRIEAILKSKDVDYLGYYNTGEFFRELFKSYLVDGDVFVQFVYEHKKNSRDFVLTPVKLNIIPTECVSDDNLDKNVINGVKLDSKGRAIGYYITTSNFNDTSTDDLLRTIDKKIFIPKKTDNNQIQIIHLANRKRPRDLRGIPVASHLFHEFVKIKEAVISELDAMCMNAQILGYVQRDVDTPIKSDFAIAGNPYRRDTVDVPASNNQVWNSTNIVVNHLERGEKFEQIATQRPNLNINEFVSAVLMPVCSSIGVPKEVLLASYNSNYSASRASIQQMWKTIMLHRNDFVLNFAKPFYEAVVTELVYAGDLKLPYFLEDENKRLAWLNHTWTGSGIPSLDPNKEVEALSKAVDNGFITRTEASQILYGTNFRNNISGISDEDKLLKEKDVNIENKSN